jgi:hypothetical protein
MILSRFLILFGAFCFFCAAAPAFSEETVLYYSLTEIRTPVSAQAKKKQKETKVDSEKEVVLGNGFFSVKDGSHERIYDFKTRRIHYLDHATKTHADVSLYADLAFRAGELKSRLLAAAAVEKAGGAPPENFFTLESIFGLESEKDKLKIRRENEGKEKVRFIYEAETIAEASWKDGLPDLPKAMFEKFLIYDHSLHPQIRRGLLERAWIPYEVFYKLPGEFFRDEFRLVLGRFENRPDRGYEIPKDYAVSRKRPGAIPSSADAVDLIESVKNGKKKTEAYGKDWFWSEAEKALTNKNYVGAVLFYLEYGFQAGDQAATSEAIRKIAVHQEEDAELNRLLRSLGVGGAEQAARAVKELQKLNRKKLSRVHVLDVLIAGQKAILGKSEEAEKSLLSALKVNPRMAGVYKDLGDLFYGDFDTTTAWLCWDFGRALAPRHFVFAPIDDYEKELARNFADFF